MGPLSDDGLYKENKHKPDWPRPLLNSWTQMCITDKKLARKFNLALDKIAFIKTGADARGQGKKMAKNSPQNKTKKNTKTSTKKKSRNSRNN